MWRRVFSWPATPTGWWSFGFGVGFLICFGTQIALVFAGQRGGETFFSNLWLAGAGLLAAASAIIGGALAAVAVFSKGERSILSFGTLGLGLLVLFFVSGELVVPH